MILANLTKQGTLIEKIRLRRTSITRCLNFSQNISSFFKLAGIKRSARVVVRMDKHHVFSDEVYWRLVDLKDQGNYRSVDEAVRPLLGLPLGKNPFKKRFEVEKNGSDFERCSWYRPQNTTSNIIIDKRPQKHFAATGRFVDSHR